MKDFSVTLQSTYLKDSTGKWFAAVQYKGTVGDKPIAWGDRGPDVEKADLETSLKTVFDAVMARLFVDVK